MPTDLDAVVFAPPGPGHWRQDPGHFPDPVTTLYAELFTPAMAAGTAKCGERYGSPSHHAAYEFVNRYCFGRAIPLDEVVPPEALEADIERRVAAAASAFAERRWDDDVARWHNEVKPASIHAHLALQAVDVAGLDDEAAAAHLTRCIAHFRTMAEQHHDFNTPATFPLADFLARATAWTGRPGTDILPLLRGASPVSGGGGPELQAAAAAIRGDAAAARDLARGATLEELRGRAAPVGPAVGAYLTNVSFRLTTGFDFLNRTGAELPGLLRRAVCEAVEALGDPRAARHVVDDLAAELRAAVPAGERADFDDGLDTARRTWQLRDERGVYSDAWAAGILRLSFLTVGRRLVERGALENPADLFEATAGEVPKVVLGTVDAPDAVELAARAATRVALASVEVPESLGEEPPPPPPWLERWPERFLAAVAAQGALLTPRDGSDPPVPGPVRGLAANPGICEGRARVVVRPEELALVEPGDILVMPTTSEAICVVVPLLAGIVTDHGGLLTHAAIVAREVGIPAVVSCGNATTAVGDGDLVRVDGTEGTVTILGRAS